MVTILFHPQELTEEQIQQEKQCLRNYFEDTVPKEGILVNSLSFQSSRAMSDSLQENDPIDCLIGTEYIHEELLGCRYVYTLIPQFNFVDQVSNNCFYLPDSEYHQEPFSNQIRQARR